MKFQNPKGTVDYYPEMQSVQNQVFNTLREVAVNYGFKEVNPPVIESLQLLEAKQGEEIKSQIFTLEQRSGEKLALRAELTPSLARMFIEQQKQVQKPVKWFAVARNWRYEKPQAGRLREFFQFNVECYGSDKPECDAEIISLIIDLLRSLGLTEEDFFVKVNNRKLLQGLLTEIAAKSKLADMIRVIDKKEKISPEEFEKELKQAGLNGDEISRLVKVLDTTDLSELGDMNQEAQEGADELKNIINLLGDKQKFVRVDLSTARGLAYYTGTVFEAFDITQKFRSIAGGGRYDKMIELFGGEPTPVTGFGLGYATLKLLLEDRKKLPKPDFAPDYFIAAVNEEMRPKAFEIAAKLRKDKKVEIDVMGRKLGKQFQYANTVKAKKVIVIGPDELAKGKVTIRDMETGKEEQADIDSVQ